MNQLQSPVPGDSSCDGTLSALASHSNTRQRSVHVVHLLIALNVGGLEQVVIDLASRADRKRFRNTIVCIRERGQRADRAESSGVPVISLNCNGCGLPSVLLRLVRLLYRLNPDVLHTHNAHPHFVGSLAAAMLGVPVVINTKHGRNTPEIRSSVIANRIAALLSSVVVPVSADAARVAMEIEHVPRRKVRVIHNGIDLEMFPFPDRSTQTGTIRAIHVARLNLIKDQKTLLEAVRLVVDRAPEFRLTVVGDGPMRNELLAFRDTLQLGDHVEFLGERTDVPALLANSDIFLLSSLQEGLSLTLLEAMAMGLAVVATDVGGNREVVIPGRTGFLVPSQSPKRLAMAVLDFVREPQLAREMGHAGRARVEELFNRDLMVRQYEALYERLGQTAACGTLGRCIPYRN